MTARIPLSARFTAALILIAAMALPAIAGPLPLPVLDDMRARTVAGISDAESRIKRLYNRMAVATDQFSKDCSTAHLLPVGEYEKLVGNHGQETAELSAQIAGQQAVVASLTVHLGNIDEQINCWREMIKADSDIADAISPSFSETERHAATRQADTRQADTRQPDTRQADTRQARRTPAWLKAMVAAFEAEPLSDPARTVYQYTYDGQTVYYIPAPCCDQLSKLYNVNGRVICEPDGGFGGGGDGMCPSFFEKRSDEVLIWEDPRALN